MGIRSNPDKNKEIRRDDYHRIIIPMYIPNLESYISKKEALILRKSLYHMQAKMVTFDFSHTISNLFKLNPFWFLNFNCIKTLVKMLIS